MYATATNSNSNTNSAAASSTSPFSAVAGLPPLSALAAPGMMNQVQLKALLDCIGDAQRTAVALPSASAALPIAQQQQATPQPILRHPLYYLQQIQQQQLQQQQLQMQQRIQQQILQQQKPQPQQVALPSFNALVEAAASNRPPITLPIPQTPPMHVPALALALALGQPQIPQTPQQPQRPAALAACFPTSLFASPPSPPSAQQQQQQSHYIIAAQQSSPRQPMPTPIKISGFNGVEMTTGVGATPVAVLDSTKPKRSYHTYTGIRNAALCAAASASASASSPAAVSSAANSALRTAPYTRRPFSTKSTLEDISAGPNPVLSLDKPSVPAPTSTLSALVNLAQEDPIATAELDKGTSCVIVDDLAIPGDGVNPSRSSPIAVPSTPPTGIVPANVVTGSATMFKLVHEPHELQRKSYRNERRYILPNPLILSWVGPSNASISGYAEVLLASDKGEELQPELQDLLDGGKRKRLDEDKRVSFGLMMRATSGDTRFRLLFRIRYTIAGEEVTEHIVSQAFRVESNRKKCFVEKPKAQSLKPCEGPADGKEEVWIWGSHFADKGEMRVRFGSTFATIVRAENNILECAAPRRPDLTQDTPVPVQIGNVHPQHGIMWAPEVLIYTYKVGKSGSSANNSSASSSAGSSPVQPSGGSQVLPSSPVLP